MVMMAAHDSHGRFAASSSNEKMASKKAEDDVGGWRQQTIMMVYDGKRHELRRRGSGDEKASMMLTHGHGDVDGNSVTREPRGGRGRGRYDGRGRGRSGRSGCDGGRGQRKGTCNSFHGIDVSDPTRNFTSKQWNTLGTNGREYVVEKQAHLNSGGSRRCGSGPG